MSAIRGHFNGKVIVLDEPANLRPNQRVTVSPEPEQVDPGFGTAAYVAREMAKNPISDEDAELMRRAIEEDCERIEPDSDINID